MNSRDAIPFIYRLIAVIMCFAGAIATVLGVSFSNEEDLAGEIWPLLVAIGGALVIIFGLFVLFLSFRSTNRIDKLIENGDYVYADILEIAEEPGVRVNGYPVFRVKCQYIDPLTNHTHYFLSRTFYLGEKTITKDKVKVYVDRDSDFKNYLVLVEDILPR